MHKINIKPLSQNKAWRGGRRFKTKEYKDYEDDLNLLLPARMEIPKGELTFILRVGFSNKGSDLSNILKPFEDIVSQKYGFNDNRNYKIVLIKIIVPKGEEFISFEIKKRHEKRI